MSPKDETWEKSDTGAGIKAAHKALPIVQYETKTLYSILRQDVCVFYKKKQKRGTFLVQIHPINHPHLELKKWL